MKVFFDRYFQRVSNIRTIGLVLPYLTMICFVLILAFVSFKRKVLGYGTETDFLGTFVPEAIRFLNGDPLQVSFHPPLYSIILASIYYIIGDWMKSGLTLSIIASFAVAISCYEFFRIKFGKISGIGAILALAVSPTFISYSTQATSDLFFMALFFGGLLFIALAGTKNMKFCWLMAGLLTGAAVITRTNGISLVGFLLFAFACKSKKKSSRVNPVMLFIIGILIPIVLWCCFAIYSGSPLLPKYSYRNLALTYFSDGGDRISADSMRRLPEGLTTTWQVLTKAPVHIAKTYIRDLVANIKGIFFKENLLMFPYILLLLPGLYVLIFRRFNKFNRVLAFNLLAMFLFLNFKASEDRFFLFLVPFMGAGIASLLTMLYLEAKENCQSAIILLLALFLLFLPALSIKQIKHTFYRSNQSYDAFKASRILKNDEGSRYATVIARKPHLSFYAKMNRVMFPDEDSLEDLKSAIREIVGYQRIDRKFYLFYGIKERQFRPKLAILSSPNSNVPWLRQIGWGEENGGWVLYEILSERF